jgi:hypothetical protein
MKALGRLFLLLIFVAVFVHGYFQVQYNTISPCEAAIERVKLDMGDGGLVDQALGGLITLGQDVAGKKRLAVELEQEAGIMGCYQIALTGQQK